MSWERVRGHEALVEGFRRVVRRGRLAHAYLFTGPKGVGKHLFARELAKALLCEGNKGELEACDACPACIQVEAGTHPDFFAASRPPEALEFPIDLMRSLCQSFSLKSARGCGKVVLIDDADDLNEESANCFLKTLEEPPPRSVLILIGSSPDRQLSTIVSRCQVVRFEALPNELVDSLLEAAGVADPDQRARLVRLGQGSVGRALALADPALGAFRLEFLTGLCQAPPDMIALGEKLTGFVDEAGKESAARRGRASLVLRLLVEFLEDALSVSVGGEARRTGSEEARLVQGLAARLVPEALMELIGRCLEADEQVERRAQLDLVLEALLDGWAQRVAA